MLRIQDGEDPVNLVKSLCEGLIEVARQEMFSDDLEAFNSPFFVESHKALYEVIKGHNYANYKIAVLGDYQKLFRFFLNAFKKASG